SYLGEMVEIVFNHKGTIDKYIGDAIMAVWNWPLQDSDHALNALRAAVQMQKTLEEMQEKWQAEGLPKLQIGIGIHSGPAILGNIGSPRRMEQTAIGDTVNVASRLEGLNKTIGPQFGSYILASETTLEAAGLDGIIKSALVADFQVVPAGETEIRGRLQKMKLYAILPESRVEESEKQIAR
ncbi:MAG TPA: adenylate/guanylate cyclase domain-containing protein, partial [Abditibacteriaceae bacterium]